MKILIFKNILQKDLLQKIIKTLTAIKDKSAPRLLPNIVRAIKKPKEHNQYIL